MVVTLENKMFFNPFRLGQAENEKVQTDSPKKKAVGEKIVIDVCFESASSNFLVCSTLPTRRNKQHRITVTYAQIASGEVEVKW